MNTENYAYHRIKDTAYQVTAHVPSEHIYEQMIYYAHHRCKVSLQHVRIDVPSDSTDA